MVILGCIVSTKWLDDEAPFLCEWSDMSKVPMHILTGLERLTLAVFGHSLWISEADWMS
ncbi:hypothetical protein B0H14DRAFT_2718361 [Mycena olivaceomarginata]|nr:hypothetical protein B0H14DRAFT_2718361 [Mycena olivaceomarginata]